DKNRIFRKRNERRTEIECPYPIVGAVLGLYGRFLMRLPDKNFRDELPCPVVPERNGRLRKRPAPFDAPSEKNRVMDEVYENAEREKNAHGNAVEKDGRREQKVYCGTMQESAMLPHDAAHGIFLGQ